MNKKYKPLLILAIFLAVMLASALYIRSHDLPVLNPAGKLASSERNLIIEATALMLVVVIPVYFFTFTIAWRYREDNKKALYEPDWDRNRALEMLWWAIPGVIITILAVITIKSSHDLDPFKPLASNNQPLKVQVIALQWRWLFIYPDQNIATVNAAEIPANRPVNFYITSDAPMNSFWIPQLAGQIYAMSGMSSQLHVIANKTGDYQGVSANLSGEGFADMNFLVRSTNDKSFGQWIKSVKKINTNLSVASYNQLAKPNLDNSIAFYGNVSPGIYDSVLHKYIRPAPSRQSIDYYVADSGVRSSE